MPKKPTTRRHITTAAEKDAADITFTLFGGPKTGWRWTVTLPGQLHLFVSRNAAKRSMARAYNALRHGGVQARERSFDGTALSKEADVPIPLPDEWFQKVLNDAGILPCFGTMRAKELNSEEQLLARKNAKKKARKG